MGCVRKRGKSWNAQVRIADLRENLDVTRIGELTEKDIERFNKYKRALKTLTEC